MINTDSIIEFLGGIPLLQRLPNSSLKKIAQVVKLARFDRGEYIIHKGERGDGLYFIWSGEALVTGDSEDGRHNVFQLKDHDSFGTVEPSSDQQEDVIASSELICLVLPHQHGTLLQSKSIWNSDETHGICSSVETILNLVPLEASLFRGFTLPDAPRSARVFGGQLVGQALAAASKTVTFQRTVHHLQAYFLVGAELDDPITYVVQRMHDGEKASHRMVTAMQKDEVMFMLIASFQKQERGFEHQEANMPSVPSPDMLMPLEDLLATSGLTLNTPLLMAYRKNPRFDNKTSALKSFDPWPIEIRLCGPDNTATPNNSVASLRYWFRAKGELSDEAALHRCVVAYASDLLFIQIGAIPHHTDEVKVNIFSLNHTIWFHRPFNADDWLLYVVNSPSAYDARVLCTGQIFSMKGELVASVTQEGVIRRLKPPKPAIQAKY